jgi:hypothetical protein
VPRRILLESQDITPLKSAMYLLVASDNAPSIELTVRVIRRVLRKSPEKLTLQLSYLGRKISAVAAKRAIAEIVDRKMTFRWRHRHDPQSGDLLVSVNEQDASRDNFVPDCMTPVQHGGFLVGLGSTSSRGWKTSTPN